jgi:hypothetical protein
MTEAYEGALIDIGITDREDPITELTAKSIVNVTVSGSYPWRSSESSDCRTDISYWTRQADDD